MKPMVVNNAQTPDRGGLELLAPASASVLLEMSPSALTAATALARDGFRSPVGQHPTSTFN
jgi:hypothetical protein